MNRLIKIPISLISLYSPAPIRTWLSSKIQSREVSRAIYVAQNYHVTREEYLSALNSLDLEPYNTIFLHTSISNIGKVQGGAKMIAKSLYDFSSSRDITLLASALPFRGRFYDYLQSHDTFDVRTAPIAMGSINEVLSNYPDVERSIHPTHSVIALGPRSHQYVCSHHLDNTPFGVHSPYYQLILNKGAVLLLGATLNNLTFIHAIEDMIGDALPFSPYCKRSFSIRCTDWNGQELTVSTPCHSPLKSMLRDLSMLEKPMKECGALNSCSLGSGQISLVDTYRFTNCYLNLMLQGKSIYGRHIVSKRLVRRIKEIQSFLQTIE